MIPETRVEVKVHFLVEDKLCTAIPSTDVDILIYISLPTIFIKITQSLGGSALLRQGQMMYRAYTIPSADVDNLYSSIFHVVSR